MTTQHTQLPPGVVEITGSECPPGTLGMWRDYRRQGPAYGVGAGYDVDLSRLPVGSSSMARNVSSWVNMTQSDAKLISRTKTRVLRAGESMEEPSQENDTVERIEWVM
ncbi:hypothetical protein ACFW9F_26865 [Streptomyces sp. NPDC059506]|uniref:Uncharacterized protein n=1 Tax=Streptomyces thermolineatus TaxID=44033 RepID=A0ABN3LHI4_9ACTN|nr:MULTISPECIES: hypothetical protein [unclassified Streptomyces]MCZ2525902.1 hypothetical protein [Streptomyces sp. HB2AG]PLW73354.1 hypothetical protein C0036_07715 [Streptomyces sp. DJ]QMV24646.1 hypothetical protein GQS52_26025 [Streptomyces sp. SCUT-3]